MRAIGTEPGDFVEFDLDLIEADRHQKIHDLLQKIIPALQDELNCQLSLAAQRRAGQHGGRALDPAADGRV